jgi:hypothetical protein
METTNAKGHPEGMAFSLYFTGTLTQSLPFACAHQALFYIPPQQQEF